MVWLRLSVLLFTSYFLTFLPSPVPLAFAGSTKSALDKVLPVVSKVMERRVPSKKCAKGWRRHKKSYCVRNVCPVGMARSKKTGRCYCAGGYRWETRGRRYCVPVKCRPGQFRASDQRCYCHSGSVLRGKGHASRCVPTSCPRHQHVSAGTGRCQCDAGFKSVPGPGGTRACVPAKRCPKGAVYSPRTATCIFPRCPRGMVRPGDRDYCVHLRCPAHLKRNPQTKRCEPISCPSGQRLARSRMYCVPVRCPAGQSHSPQTDRCAWPGCPAGQIRPVGKSYCVPVRCPKGALRGGDRRCHCPKGRYLPAGKDYCVPKECGTSAYRASDLRCYPCPKGMFRPQGALRCVPRVCPRGSVRDPVTQACRCPAGLRLAANGRACVRSTCREGEDRHPVTDSCRCKAGFMPFKNKPYCVPRDCGETAFRGPDGRCTPCPRGKYRPRDGNVCYWKPCPHGKKRGSDGKCHGRKQCNEHERPSADRTKCVPRRCPAGTRRDPISDDCVAFGKRRSVRCPTAYHEGHGGSCVPDECPRGSFRDKRGLCRPRGCPAGFVHNGTRCLPKTCPKGMTMSKGRCLATKKSCPRGTFLNPRGVCVPAPCPGKLARPSDRLELCLRVSPKWKRRCPKGRRGDRLGKCVLSRRIHCPAGSTRIGNRCFFGAS